MSRGSRPFVVTANILAQLKNADICYCSGCNVEFKIADSVVSNSTGKKRYHYLCAITLKIA
ncbi:MAG: hypothetical protein HRU07_05745 [Nitrosopumilus sp.]|nr:hypothetical protein [Nitrosopumilus sp.]NRA05649.1 hypothetical protein [Nitrosopumilus sp.]